MTHEPRKGLRQIKVNLTMVLNFDFIFTTMNYKSLNECLNDLENNGHLIRIKEEVDPNLEMATIHLKVFAKKDRHFYLRR